MRESEMHVGAAAWLKRVLHDLSQPLSALECRLYIGTLEDQGGEADAAMLRETIREGLAECQRMIAQVRAAQDEISAGTVMAARGIGLHNIE